MGCPQGFEGGGTAGNGTLATVFTLDLAGYRGGLLNLELENTHASQALTNFVCQLRDHAGGEWYTYLTGTDWATSGNSNLRYSSGTQDTLAHGALAHAHIRLNAAHAVRFQAQSAAAGTTVELRGTLIKGTYGE